MQVGKGSGGSKALVEKLVREIQKVQEQLRAQTAARQRAEGDAATAQHEAKAAVGMPGSLPAYADGRLFCGFAICLASWRAEMFQSAIVQRMCWCTMRSRSAANVLAKHA